MTEPILEEIAFNCVEQGFDSTSELVEAYYHITMHEILLKEVHTIHD